MRAHAILWTWAICLLAAGVWGGWPASAGGAEVETKTYTVEGKSLEEVWADIEKKGFKDADGHVHAGSATGTVSGNMIAERHHEEKVAMPDCPDGMGWECTLEWDMEYKVKIVITLPTWPGASETCEKAKAEWDRFMEKLREHEEGHAAVAEKALADAGPKSPLTSTQQACTLEECQRLAREDLKAQAENEIKRLQAAIDKAGEQYDKDTNHGATQGATLDTSIECPPGPAEQLGDILDELDFLSLPAGLMNSLSSKLKGAIKAIEEGNIEAAKGKIDAFIKEVKAQSGKKIDEEVADDFIERAGQARDALDD